MLLQKCHPGPVDFPCFLSCPEFVWSSAMEKWNLKACRYFPARFVTWDGGLHMHPDHGWRPHLSVRPKYRHRPVLRKAAPEHICMKFRQVSSLQAFGEEFCSHWAKIDYCIFSISDFNHGPNRRASLIGFVPASAWTQQFRSRSATTLPLLALHVMYVPWQPFTTWDPIGLGNCIYWSGTCTCAISEFTNSRSMPRS